MLYNIETFNKYFKGENFTSQVVYASKAFLVPKMCKIVDELDWMIDAVSLGDLYLIGKSIPLSRAVFHGNNKSIEELTYAINNNAGIIVVDNYQELLLIEKLKNDDIEILYNRYININKLIYYINPNVAKILTKYYFSIFFFFPYSKI